MRSAARIAAGVLVISLVLIPCGIHPGPAKIKPPVNKVLLECVNPTAGMNYNLRSDPTVRYYGPSGQGLYQYQVCREA